MKASYFPILMRVLYTGDSPAGGAANYLLGIFKYLKAEYVHIPPSVALNERWFRIPFDVFIFSDYSRKQLSPRLERLIAKKVEEGAGLLMIGGWGSFSGPFGGWKGSLIEKMLPVTCLGRDDRLNFPGGALMLPEKRHPVLDRVIFSKPPVICGLNRVRPKKNSTVILAARKISVKSRGKYNSGSVALAKQGEPLLVIHGDPAIRTAAFATDAAPHWCGGLVDWGGKSRRLHVKDDIWVEVGSAYIRFFSNLIQWLARGGMNKRPLQSSSPER